MVERMDGERGDSEREDLDSPLESLAAGAGTLAGFTIAGVLLALNVEFWWMGFVAIGGLVPIFVGAARLYEERGTADRTERRDDGEDAALARLRERYADGEITEAEFERRVERLLETESVADARDRPGTRGDAGTAGSTAERGREPERGRGRDRERERDREPEEV